jgi:hypothetical protein
MNIRIVALSCIPAVLLSTSSFAHGMSSFAHSMSVNSRSFTPIWGAANSALYGVKPGDAVSLNPQPLPPKIGNVSGVKPGDAVSLNPQPLPPKIGAANAVQSPRP